MVVTNLESLVLRGARVAGDVMAKIMRFGSRMDHGQTAASLSHPRHPSQSWRRTGYQTDSRLSLADSLDEDTAAIRAGRSESFAGVPVSRSPAGIAGWAVLLGWSQAVGEPAAARLFGSFTAKTRASVGNVAPRQSLASHLRAEDGESDQPSPLSNRLGKRGKPKLAWPMPASRMPTASTRGKTAIDCRF